MKELVIKSRIYERLGLQYQDTAINAKKIAARVQVNKFMHIVQVIAPEFNSCLGTGETETWTYNSVRISVNGSGTNQGKGREV